MRTQAQFTIYSLNDVIAATTAPSNPYKGQLWVDTSKTPPVTMVYNGTAWVEQNGTDTIRSSITTLTTKQSNLETNLNGLTSTVSTTTKKVETLTSDMGVLEEKVLGTETQISELKQTASQISATVANKADAAYGSSSSSFGWSLKSTGFYLYSSATTVMSVTSSGLTVKGAITATSGTLENMTITGKLTFGGNSSYYINANYNDSSYFINLPGFRVDVASQAVFSGKLSAPSGTIGGFTITTSAIYKTKTSYNSTTSGVYIGTDGIGLGAGTFYVTAAGKLYANNAEIYGYIYCSGSDEVKFYGTKETMDYDTAIGGTGIYSVVHSRTNTGIMHNSYAYIRPFGSIVVPENSSLYANDGMLFGVMSGATYNIQHLLAGMSCFYHNDGNGYFASDVLFRVADKTWLEAWYETGNGFGWIVDWGNPSIYSVMWGPWYVSSSNSYISSIYVSNTEYAALYGNWRVGDKLYFGTSTAGYITTATVGSSLYPYLYGTWYASTLKLGTSTTSYNIRIDSDQITFYYGTTEVGDIEAYTSYVDVQGTFKTNGKNWISSSDARIKNSIQDFSEAYSVLFDHLKPRLYKYNAGKSNRLHPGFIVQETLAAMEVAQVSTSDFAAVCAFGDPADEKTEWGLRYDEFIPLNTWEIQKLKARVAELENIIKKRRYHNETERAAQSK